MTPVIARSALVALGLGAMGFGVANLRPRPEPVPRSPRSLASMPKGEVSDSADFVLLRLARTVTPFRYGHRSPSSRYGLRPFTTALPAIPALPKPVLLLSGILWGREPAALVEGVPGQEGAVLMRTGDSVGPVRLVSISRDRARLKGLDTSWTLTVREPWH